MSFEEPQKIGDLTKSKTYCVRCTLKTNCYPKHAIAAVDCATSIWVGFALSKLRCIWLRKVQVVRHFKTLSTKRFTKNPLTPARLFMVIFVHHWIIQMVRSCRAIQIHTNMYTIQCQTMLCTIHIRICTFYIETCIVICYTRSVSLLKAYIFEAMLEHFPNQSQPITKYGTL